VAEEFTCDVDKQYRSACKDVPKYSGSRYCVLHEPDEAKNKEDFEEAKKSKLDREDYDFRGTVFPEGTSEFQGFEFEANVSFEGAQFSSMRISFSKAKFSGQWTDFNEAQTSSTSSTSFDEAHFSGYGTQFRGAQFSGGASFQGAQFSAASTSF
jgi:uncharacterized protein YjbI with pentapeptide repeats